MKNAVYYVGNSVSSASVMIHDVRSDRSLMTVGPCYPPEKIVPGTFHKTLTNFLLVIINLAVSMDENR
jgi:hypothetical protein